MSNRAALGFFVFQKLVGTSTVCSTWQACVSTGAAGTQFCECGAPLHLFGLTNYTHLNFGPSLAIHTHRFSFLKPSSLKLQNWGILLCRIDDFCDNFA